MGYTVSKTSALQTAVKAAVDIAVAELTAGFITDHDALMARVSDVKDQFTDELYEAVDKDNAASGGSRGGSSSYGGGSGGGNKPFSSEEAGNTILSFGAFKGLTLNQVYLLDGNEASAYSEGRYTKAGQDWLRWAAKNDDPKGAFIKVRAQAVLDSPPTA